MITNIQLLRGVAALMVVVFHLVVKMQPFGFDGSQVSFLQGGVDIFFVISGFIMVHISHERERSGGQFMADRIIRIVPIYWLLTLLAYFSGADKTPSVWLPPGKRSNGWRLSSAYSRLSWRLQFGHQDGTGRFMAMRSCLNL
jgi:peptidoglycan/LPS O-acetylase OafA/YrhL